jgi:hypothetical protein
MRLSTEGGCCLEMITNKLYMAVLPLIHLGRDNFGLTEEVLTLLPNRDLATEFVPADVQGYIDIFNNRADKYLSGGGSAKYFLEREITEDGRVIVKVTQNVNSQQER